MRWPRHIGHEHERGRSRDRPRCSSTLSTWMRRPRRVRIGGGATWGPIAEALQPHGLAISSGDTVSVGVGGLTLGGGIGWMVRTWGLALDSLVEAEVVLADGSIVTANESDQAELFWALRGGGGNFGVVTAFTFQAHPLEGIVSGSIHIDPGGARRGAQGRSRRHACRAARAQRHVPRHARVRAGRCRRACSSRSAGRVPTRLRQRRRSRRCSRCPGVTGHELDAEGVPGHPGREPGTSARHHDRRQQRIRCRPQRRRDRPAGRVPRLARRWSAHGPVHAGRAEPGRSGCDGVRLAGQRGAAHLRRVSAAGHARRHRGAASGPGSQHSEMCCAGAYGNFMANAGGAETIYPPKTLKRLRALKEQVDPAGVFRGNQVIAP